MTGLSDMTVLIQRARQGDHAARDQLFAQIYDELHGGAERLVHQKGPAAAPSSLVHEAYLRLFSPGPAMDIPNRRYFYFAATRKMRDILVERIRKAKGRCPTHSFDAVAEQFLEDFRRRTSWEFLAVHQALEDFQQSENLRQRRRHELLELVYFGGLTVKEGAELLEVSYSQAREDQRLALAELAVELKRREP